LLNLKKKGNDEDSAVKTWYDLVLLKVGRRVRPVLLWVSEVGLEIKHSFPHALV
jgi:hypothetical protein